MPLEIAEDEIAPVNAPKNPLAILLSKIRFIFSLPIFLGFNFLMVLSIASFANSEGFFISLR